MSKRPLEQSNVDEDAFRNSSGEGAGGGAFPGADTSGLYGGVESANVDGKTGAGQFEGVKRQRIEHEADQMEVRFVISPQDTGLVIGRGGASAKSIREGAGVFLNVLKSQVTGVEHIMVLKGVPENIGAAVQLIGELMVKERALKRERSEEGKEGAAFADSTVSFKVLFPMLSAGPVIGKAGANVRAIVADSGAQVQVSHDPLPNSSEKSAVVTGSVQAVHAALVRIFHLLKVSNVHRDRDEDVSYIVDASAFFPFVC